MRWECLFLFRLQEERPAESRAEEQFWLQSEYAARCILVVVCCRKSVCCNWTEACTVSLRRPEAFGMVVRQEPEPELRVCLVLQTMPPTNRETALRSEHVAQQRSRAHRGQPSLWLFV